MYSNARVIESNGSEDNSRVYFLSFILSSCKHICSLRLSTNYQLTKTYSLIVCSDITLGGNILYKPSQSLKSIPEHYSPFTELNSIVNLMKQPDLVLFRIYNQIQLVTTAPKTYFHCTNDQISTTAKIEYIEFGCTCMATEAKTKSTTKNADLKLDLLI